MNQKKPEGQPKRFHFTAEKLKNLPVPGKPVYYFDDDPKQLAVRIQPTGSAMFVLVKRSNGATYRKTLGKVGELALDAARKRASHLISKNAEWKSADYEGAAPLAKPLDVEQVTFGQAFEMHVIHARARMANKGKNPDVTERNLRYVYNGYLSHLANTPIENLSGERMVSLHAKIAESGPYSANRAIEVCRAVFSLMIRKNLLVSDPTKSVVMYPEHKRKVFLQPDELNRLEKVLDAEPNTDVVDFVRLLLKTGVRKSSLYTARWDDINFPLAQWNIPETKNGEALTVELIPSAVATLEVRKERRENEWVFPSKESESGHVEDYKNQWERIRKAAGIPHVNLHDLRRTCASYQVISGQSLPIVGASLGHKSVKSTEVYAHLHQDAVRRSLLAGEEMQKQMMAEAAKKEKAEERRKAQKLAVVKATA